MSVILCGRCSICCKEPVIPINDCEIRKIKKATGMTAKMLVRFYSFEEIKWDEDSEDWVELAAGRRLMSLRKIRNRCIFLTKNGCSIYKARPRVCKIFPVDFFFSDNLENMKVGIQSRIKGCKAKVSPKSKKDKDLIKIGRALFRSDLSYQKKVAKWNRTNPRGTVAQYLDFLKI